MTTETMIERRIVVYAVWLSLGPLGFCLILQGIHLDHLPIGLSGTVMLALAFAAHLIANAYFDQTFTRGEIAFGTAVMTLWGVVFLISWFSFDLSQTDLMIALALTVAAAGCVAGHIVTRHGARGAFSRFHTRLPE